MNTAEIKKVIYDKLGIAGKIITMSKTTYRNQNESNLVFFNANICVNKEKVWWGDLDITKSRAVLHEIAKNTNADIYVLQEMDARFENEKGPEIKKFVYRANANGSETLGESIKSYYFVNENDKLVKTL